ncbi:uncharacterized protein L203_102279 [Cryptococcus depauperatus CBS 7841]|uniref:Uncharacterized protein n=1 Tax=Cryptococcus depauperatus CBS 7841 TaxID=1295531 RepID=A0AAJ8M0J2_9TREE
MCLGNTKPSAFNLLAKYPTHHGWLPESLCPKDGKTSRAASLHLPYGVFHSRLPLILKGERAGREYRVSRPNRICSSPVGRDSVTRVNKYRSALDNFPFPITVPSSVRSSPDSDMTLSRFTLPCHCWD